ncbi:hypothetical protein MAR_011137 [Mya arenaria]|uniref:Uncharacterized protein n=1 Tax=Mya arenaria TaxID=6604 RepID=A0ABY7FX24_MYAAR|nr:hypothetical protein MAR_011137 [Mya arenaria]
MSSASLAFDPPYKDVFADKITDNDDKLSLLIAKWDTVHQFAFPSRYVSGKFRRIQTHWFNDYFWLRYSQSACGVYCAPCYLFAGSVTRSLVSSVASDPSNFGKTLSRHTKSELHVNSVEAAENFRSIMSGEQKDIVASMSSSYNVLVERNRQILHAIVETIILCGRQNLLVCVEYILAQLVPLSQMLQNKKCDLVEAAKEAKIVCQLVSQQRNDEAVFNEFYGKAVIMAAAVDVQPTKPRTAARQQHRQNAPAESFSDYWRRNMLLPFLDHLTTELSDRLLNAEDRLNAQFLIPSNLEHLTDDKVEALYHTLQSDLPALDAEEFKGEIRRWNIRGRSEDNPPTSIAETD